RKDGMYAGIEAVIDKDLASSLLSINLSADLFLISTAVDKVFLDFGKPHQRALDSVTLAEIVKFRDEGHFAPGSMLPKIEAVIEYLENGGQKAIITSPVNIERSIEGKAGTIITP
ncbi:carbamate kinase, partial [Elusimicrobiota bacterium]